MRGRPKDRIQGVSPPACSDGLFPLSTRASVFIRPACVCVCVCVCVRCVCICPPLKGEIIRQYGFSPLFVPVNGQIGVKLRQTIDFPARKESWGQTTEKRMECSRKGRCVCLYTCSLACLSLCLPACVRACMRVYLWVCMRIYVLPRMESENPFGQGQTYQSVTLTMADPSAGVFKVCTPTTMPRLGDEFESLMSAKSWEQSPN
ncbi:unnamed protein product [Protopolystoma xenopodis]|uniref:Uncharacterized protein n=1 Tax=Protopolystoma xenopodis TaxID=117903 RepID=A0A448WL19_9PLAT|nr:unnamed protein product [Protopolystoma xenopodis]